MSFDKKFDEGKTVVLRIPEIDYVLVHWPNNKCTPWVAAYGYNEKEGYWCQGHYFTTKKGAIEYLKETLKEKLPICIERRFCEMDNLLREEITE